MVRLTAIVSFALAALVAARPVPVRQELGLVTRATFTELAYADFQISNGTTGDAQAKANAVFVDPFNGRDLATVSAAELTAVQNMRVAAEAAETNGFNPAIKAATGDAAKALQNGKIMNKVLKLTGEVQAIQIKIAQGKAAGKDTSSDETKLAEEQKKLNTNIATDTKNAGQVSQAVLYTRSF